MFIPGTRVKVQVVSSDNQVAGEKLSGFEDQLTVGRDYIATVNQTGKGFEVVCDDGKPRHHGLNSFVVLDMVAP